MENTKKNNKEFTKFVFGLGFAAGLGAAGFVILIQNIFLSLI